MGGNETSQNAMSHLQRGSRDQERPRMCHMLQLSYCYFPAVTKKFENCLKIRESTGTAKCTSFVWSSQWKEACALHYVLFVQSSPQECTLSTKSEMLDAEFSCPKVKLCRLVGDLKYPGTQRSSSSNGSHLLESLVRHMWFGVLVAAHSS